MPGLNAIPDSIALPNRGRQSETREIFGDLYSINNAHGQIMKLGKKITRSWEPRIQPVDPHPIKRKLDRP